MENKKVFAPSHQEKACFKGFFCVFAILLILSALCFSAGTKATTVEVGTPVEEHPELFLTRSLPTHGEGKIAVFLIDFPDYRNDNPYATVDFYDKLYFSGGVRHSWDSYHDSISDFYYDQSFGKLRLSGKVFDWYTAKHERSYYDNDKAALVIEAAEYYIAKGFDFSQFDGNSDGTIDTIVYHFAGEPSRDKNDPWYTGVNIGGNLGEISELKLTTMIQVWEGAYDSTTFSGAVSLFSCICHEMMHSLGLPDLYSSYDDSKTAFDLMCLNEQTINPYFKILLGWVDKVQIITENTTNIRLDSYSAYSAGDIAIVTDQYNGLYDEFIVIAFRNYNGQTKTAAWYIDARLNNDKTGFEYSNLYYDPRPDIQGAHDPTHGIKSPHLFVEELDSDQFQNYIGYNTFTHPSGFGKNDIIGPNSMPSTDTHDGKYTGIKIFNFNEHNDEYLTFDVSFVKDTSAPIVITNENDLAYAKTIKVHFSEHVYCGQSFDSICVTDPDGKPLEAKITLPHYPKNELEIVFADKTYLEGYTIVLPEGCLLDSSGNKIEAVTLSAPSDKIRSPLNSTILPSSANFIRANDEANFFVYDNNIVVITDCYEMINDLYISDAAVEFMKLDLDGNVLTHQYIRNPFENSVIVSVWETENESFIIVCKESFYSTGQELLFCIDKNGALKWTNDAFRGSGIMFSEAFILNDGAVFRASNTGLLYYVDSKTGDAREYTPKFVTDLNTSAIGGVINLPKDRLLVQTDNYREGIKTWQILDVKANRIIAEAENKCLDLNCNDYVIFEIHDNNNGTYLVRYRIGNELLIGLLDADLNIVKSVLLSKDELNPMPPIWLNDGGFFRLYFLEKKSHDESKLSARRYDKYLNPLWETELTANFIHFFSSPSGEIMSYRSQLFPERECYIDNYGNDANLITEHKHSLVYKNSKPATCLEVGYAEHWYCTDCGCKFSDEGITLITDINSIIIPIADHTEEIIPGYPATCINSGVSDGKKCSVCGEILLSQKDIPAGGAHSEKIIPRLEPTCASVGRTEGKECSVCGMVLIESKEIPALPHTEVIIYGYTATCKKEGRTDGAKCSVCGKTLISQKSTPKSNEHNPTIVSATEPTCTKQGRTEGAQCADCGIILVSWSVVPKLDHTEKILPAIAPTYTTTGKTEGKQCSECGKVLVEQEIVPIPEQTEEITTSPENEPPADTGCGAAISAVMLPIVILGCAIIKKKD